MKLRFVIIWCLMLSVFCVMPSVKASAVDIGQAADKDYLNIATIDSRPLSIDKLLYTALNDIDCYAAFTPALLETGYIMANDGDKDGVIASTPDIHEKYSNLIKIDVPLEKVFLCAYTSAGNEIIIENWSDLAGRKVGLNSQRPYTKSRLPENAEYIEKDTVAQLMDGLVRNEYDIAIVSRRENESLFNRDDVVLSGVLSELADFLYLNKRHSDLVPAITEAIEALQNDGRAEKILKDEYFYENLKGTVLHIVSTNIQVSREEQLILQLRHEVSKEVSVEWYTIELNSRRFSRDPNRLSYFANLLRQDCVSKNISAIIVSGDDAVDFLESYYYLYFRNIPLIFYGVNEDKNLAIKGFEDYFTGIFEEASFYDTVTQALKLYPDTENIFVLNDYMTEGTYYREQAMHQLEPLSGSYNIEYSANTDINTLMEQISLLPSDTLVFAGSYFCDSNGQYFPLQETKRLLEKNCKVPIFSIFSASVEYHAVGGKSLDYGICGGIVADMLIRLLNGESIQSIQPVYDPEAYSRWVFDKNMLDEFEIKENTLPAGTSVINKVPGIWESDPRFSLTLALSLVLGVAAAIIISYFWINYRKQRELLIRDDKIREVKNRLERIINSAPLAFIQTVNGVVVDANEYTVKNMGIRTGEKSVDLYNDPIQRDEIIEQIRLQEKLENYVVNCKMKDGGVHRFLANITSSKYEGEDSYIFWAMDIEEHELQRDQISLMRQNLQTVLDTLPVSVLISKEGTGEMLYANHTAMELYNCTDIDEIIGLKAFSFLPELQPNGENSADIVKRVITSEMAVEEFRCIKLDGQEFDVRLIACLIEYNGQTASLALIEDLTSEREYQRMLNDTAIREREANQLKSRFLVNMSHEIRTPMNAIIGLTEIELHKNPPKESKEIYKKINTSAKNLLEIINDILDLSKIDAEKMELYEDDFELEDTLNSALLVAAPRLDGKNVEFMLNPSLDLPRYIYGDKTRLWQILKNFLDNSAKYTEKGKIVMSVSVDHESSDDQTIALNFVIEDTGIGMDSTQLQKIFMPYEQIKNEAQKRYSGTGLGMAISKQLCEIMNGSLQVESTVGEGTTISVKIPFKRSLNSQTEEDSIKTSQLQGLNVLAVDDDELSLDIITRLLENSGVNCMRSKSGMDAMETVLKNRDKGEFFDVILLDYMMDGLNGIETARQINTALSKAPKLLMVTSYQKLLLKQELEESGIDDVIEKPFIPSMFIHKLCAALGVDSGLHSDSGKTYIRFKDVKVLLCEDYRLNQEVAVGMFNQFGVSADIAENGEQGIALLNAGNQYDLIFMDLQMPVMDGYEAVKIIRSDPRFDDIPVVSLTADAMKEVVDHCLEIGMNDHVAKPVEFDHLYQVLVKWLPESKRDENGTLQLAQAVLPHDEALTRFGGNADLYEKALLEFAGLLPEVWPLFGEIAEKTDETAKFLHKLKGASGNLSEKDVYNHAVEFESSLRSGKPDSGLYAALTEACTAVRNRIFESIAKKVPKETGSNGSTEEFAELAAALKVALEDYNPKDTTDIINKLKSKDWPSVDVAKLEQLYEYTKKYEFDAAMEIIDLL